MTNNKDRSVNTSVKIFIGSTTVLAISLFGYFIWKKNTIKRKQIDNSSCDDCEHGQDSI